MPREETSASRDEQLIRSLVEKARPLTGESGDYDPLIALAGEARFVLLGEASHGTHEFYRERAQMTKLRTAHEDDIAKSFTADQKAAWTKIKEEREARMKERAQQQQH